MGRPGFVEPELFHAKVVKSKKRSQGQDEERRGNKMLSVEEVYCLRIGSQDELTEGLGSTSSQG